MSKISIYDIIGHWPLSRNLTFDTLLVHLPSLKLIG